MTSRSRPSFSCSQRKTWKTMEKDTREAIRSVVGSLLNIDQLKPEQEQALQRFVGGHDVVALLPTGFGKSLIFQLAPLAVKEPVPSHDIYVTTKRYAIGYAIGHPPPR
ncbi:unnamed protein product [Boreogadus saida]